MSQNLFQPHLIDNSFKNVYGLEVADINGDGRKDVIAGSTAENIIAWYEAPTWKRHIISTRHSGNITISAHDINRDGKLEIAVGSGFNIGMNSYQAYLQWLEPANKSASSDGEEWKAYKIDDLPFVHRIKFADIDADGERELVAGSIRGATGEKLDWSHPGMLVYYKIPPDPRADMWQKFTIDANLKKHHATLVVDFDDDGRLDILVGCMDGIIWYKYNKYKPMAPTSGSGKSGSWQKQMLTSFECSEVFPVNLSGGIYKDLLSIEPWHGNQLVWYKAPAIDEPKGRFERFLIDDSLNRGHTLAALDIDNDGKVEVIAGYNGEGTSLYIYRPVDLASNRWEKELIDDGLGVGISVFEDLNLDGKIDFACSGLSTHNIKWYENISKCEVRSARCEV